MQISFRPMQWEDGVGVIDIFNHYIDHSFAAYPEKPVSYDFFNWFLEVGRGYPAVTASSENEATVGFGLLRPYHPSPTFSRTAEITYFIKPGYTRQGIGQKMLAYLEEKGLAKGIHTILASVSSLNEASLRFHRQNGFAECGRLVQVGCKKGQVFDVVYLQKMLLNH